jgi:hypothetical protein
MILGYLLDEHLPKWWRKAILKAEPGLRVWRVGDPQAPPLQSPDAVLLEWCEANGTILLTNNRGSMAGHLADHVAQGRRIQGIFIVDPTMSIIRLAADLALIAGASFEGEYLNQVQYLPRT